MDSSLAAAEAPRVETASLLTRAPEWERLRNLLSIAKARGLGGLSEQELWELPGLYRKALSDLSLMRSRGGFPQLEQELTQLCNTAHGVIYQRVAPVRGAGLIEHVGRVLPRTVRRRSGLIIIAALTMVLFAVLGWVHAWMNPTVAETVLSPRMVDGIRAGLQTAREQADLKLAAQIEPQQRMGAAIAITLNNWGVSFRAFLFGILGGLPSIIINSFNGYLLGVFAFIYFNTDPGIPVNLPLYFVSGIAPHGSIELPAICVAVAAGMLLGFSWVFPGQRPRGEALREAITDAWRLFQVCLITLLFAGSIEGFVTPLRPPTGFPDDAWMWLKVLIGCCVFSVWLLWLSRGGRAAGARASSPL